MENLLYDYYGFHFFPFYIIYFFFLNNFGFNISSELDNLKKIIKTTINYVLIYSFRKLNSVIFEIY